MPDRDPRIDDLIGFAADEKPVEFQQTFTDIVTDRIAQAIADRKDQIAQNMFREPEEEEPEEEQIEDGEDSQ
jgi:hypothetical protein